MKKKIILTVIIVFVISIISIISADIIVNSSTGDYTYSDVNKIPYNKVGLILGTSKYLSNGNINNYYKNRINAAIKLYEAGKIKYIVISGDNSRKTYNEPLDMKKDLIASGIPDSLIILDYAGFRTYDSVIRINKIFGQSKFTIISQKFHNERAVYIARHFNFDAVGFNAKDVNLYYGFKTRLREKLARANLFLDLLIDRDPKFLGEKIEIGE